MFTIAEESSAMVRSDMAPSAQASGAVLAMAAHRDVMDACHSPDQQLACSYEGGSSTYGLSPRRAGLIMSPTQREASQHAQAQQVRSMRMDTGCGIHHRDLLLMSHPRHTWCVAAHRLLAALQAALAVKTIAERRNEWAHRQLPAQPQPPLAQSVQS